DTVSPGADQPAPSDGLIRVQRVRYEEGTLEVKIPYPTVVRSAAGRRSPYHPTISQPGRSGLKRVSYRAKLVDGREVERSTVSEETLREAQPEIVLSRKPYLLGSRGAYIGKRTLPVVATAYDPGPGSCGKYANGRTCNGKRAGYGIIAVDPKVIPLGSKIYVPGYGYGIAADVGSAIQGNRVDLGFNSRSGSFKWGRRQVTIQIIE
ncbi:MAG TPA: 3D domain-containing protein, partial [Armatimonadota bacterium]|nr:3D domain-containing protein [Armatimonadota bacterium]